ncbi:MAG: hypothetical protein VB095_05960 [Anaerovorax sp.]|nr:hypothetical protein [Anaerovorax sp.]
MKAQKLAKGLRIIAQFETPSWITKYFAFKAAEVLEKQAIEIEEIKESIQPVRCGECKRRPVCILWDIRCQKNGFMNYHDFCSKGIREH